ncbi:MAG: hypothetical protein D6714_17720 [Bacteroidetes bacterium]|nr:MAG: hypothetical protein D6714_17720 [Bacteroidota bacterium]
MEKKLKMESLEKFVKQHREALDTAVPGLRVWAEIDKKLDAKKQRRLRWMPLKIAAAALVLLAVGALLGAQFNKNEAPPASLAAIAPEYEALEKQFNRQIEQKIQLLAGYHQDDYVREDLHRLDRVFQDLCRDLDSAPKGTRARIVRLMIENYEDRIRLLERVLEKVQSADPNHPSKPEEEASPINPQRHEVSL